MMTIRTQIITIRPQCHHRLLENSGAAARILKIPLARKKRGHLNPVMLSLRKKTKVTKRGAGANHLLKKKEQDPQLNGVSQILKEVTPIEEPRHIKQKNEEIRQ